MVVALYLIFDALLLLSSLTAHGKAFAIIDILELIFSFRQKNHDC